MKPTYFYQLLFVFFIYSAGLSAQNSATAPVIITGTKFTYPLIEKWITEYAKINPDTRFKLVQNTAIRENADLNIIAHQPVKNELAANQEIIYAGRYALLPVTNINNPILATTKKKRLNKKEIDNLLFQVINYEDEPATEKQKFAATIYSRDNQACASTVLAGYFGHIASEIRGKKIMGDDIYLVTAIKKDSIGVAYNNLGYLYDIHSRRLKEGIAILPLELKKETKELLSGNVDEVIAILEKTQIETIPVEKIGFIYSQQNERKEVSEFLKWVLTDGQKFNHDKGFLNLDNALLLEQTNRLNEKFLTLK